MSKRQKVLYHIKKERKLWSGDVIAWCGYTDSAKGYSDNAYVFASLKSDYMPCQECKRAKKAAGK